MKRTNYFFIGLLAMATAIVSCDNDDIEIGVAATEYEALIDLYESTEGDEWSDNTNWCTDAPLEEWYGVITNSDGTIKELNLGNNELQSSIPTTIGALSNLKVLDLSNNELQSSIPSTIGNLSSLESLNLGNNNLEKDIPSSIGNLSNLEYLNLGNNELEGSIPSSIGDLTNLEVLDLSYNNISGDIPESLANLVNLTDLYLQETDLTGEIPQSLIDQGVNVVVDLELVIPSDLIGDMANHIPIYEGVNPPNIEGWFLMDDVTAVFCEDGAYQAGDGNFYDKYFEFYDFNETDLTLKIKEQTAVGDGEGDGAYIRGEGNNFTAYFDIYITREGDNGNIITFRQATVISGTLTTTGIKDMYYAFVVTSKDNDIYDEYIAEGVYRVFEEGDGIASKISSLVYTKGVDTKDESKHSIYQKVK